MLAVGGPESSFIRGLFSHVPLSCGELVPPHSPQQALGWEKKMCLRGGGGEAAEGVGGEVGRETRQGKKRKIQKKQKL